MDKYNKYNTDIETILSSFSFPGTPYPRVPTQKMPCLSYACSADRSVCLYARAHVTVLSFSCSDHFKDFGLFTVQGIVSKKHLIFQEFRLTLEPRNKQFMARWLTMT